MISKSNRWNLMLDKINNRAFNKLYEKRTPMRNLCQSIMLILVFIIPILYSCAPTQKEKAEREMLGSTRTGESPMAKKANTIKRSRITTNLWKSTQWMLILYEARSCILPKRSIWPGDLGLQQGSWNRAKKRSGLLQPWNCLLRQRPIRSSDLGLQQSSGDQPKRCLGLR